MFHKSTYSWLNWIMYTFYYTAWWRHFWWWSLFTGLRTWWNILLRFRSLILTLLWSERWEYLFLHLHAHHHHQAKSNYRNPRADKTSTASVFVCLVFKDDIPSRNASATWEFQSQFLVTWLSLHFCWKMTFNPLFTIRRFTINTYAYAWNQLKYTEDVFG